MLCSFQFDSSMPCFTLRLFRLLSCLVLWWICFHAYTEDCEFSSKQTTLFSENQATNYLVRSCLSFNCYVTPSILPLKAYKIKIEMSIPERNMLFIRLLIVHSCVAWFLRPLGVTLYQMKIQANSLQSFFPWEYIPDYMEKTCPN